MHTCNAHAIHMRRCTCGYMQCTCHTREEVHMCVCMHGVCMFEVISHAATSPGEGFPSQSSSSKDARGLPLRA